MPKIQPFRGIRYDLGHVGSLSDVIAPPYDVIGPDFQEELYKKHPCNVVRLILNREEPGDDDAENNKYIRAARFFKNWKEEGVLFEESQAAIYVYHQEYECLGQQFCRKGFMCRVTAEPFGEGMVYPHEQTMSGPKIDRLMLTTTCKANMSQVFGLYPDAENEVQAVLDRAIESLTPVQATDHLGVVQKVWAVTDPDVVAEVVKLMAAKPTFIADGHHRYETACNYRKQMSDQGIADDHPANFVLMMMVAMEDPGLFVLPTHRLFPDETLQGLTAESLAEKLGDCFTVAPAGDSIDAAATVWEDIETRDDQGTLAFYTKADGKWSLVTITDAGRAKLAKAAEDHQPEWQELGVSILHRLVIETLLEVANPQKPGYVHLVEEVVDGMKGDDYPLAALVMPATVDHIKTLSLMGERMPPKSTYFYPKLISGLVFNPLE